jgi:hypothetical protein
MSIDFTNIKYFDFYNFEVVEKWHYPCSYPNQGILADGEAQYN